MPSVEPSKPTFPSRDDARPMTAPPGVTKPMTSEAPKPAARPEAVRPAGHQTSMLDRSHTSHAAAMPAVAPADARLRLMLQTLQSSIYSEHREWAAGQLGSSEMRTNPQVVPALVQGAREDRDSVVRCACLRALGKMNANTQAVVAALNTMKADADPRVRQEVNQVLAKFGLGPSGFADQGSPSAPPR
jgi:HEAT repeats